MRHQYIKDVSGANVSQWKRKVCENRVGRNKGARIGFYQCKSDKGEYGINITAHIDEAISILQEVLPKKRAIVVINACKIDVKIEKILFDFIKKKNSNSELYFAKQERVNEKQFLISITDVGEFGFLSSNSERLLFKNRSMGLIKALRVAFDKSSAKEYIMFPKS